jgi:nickel superoxide dismutase
MNALKSAFAILFSVCLLAQLSATEPNNNEPSKKATAAPHCEVPCGVYADQRRFEEMLEDTTTIAKAIASMNEITNGFQNGPPTVKDINQSMRWVNTKESQATNTQHIVAQYFLTQRIKPDNERYEDQLKAAHAVMVAAMKCKQDADPATAENLKTAIGQLYRAYEGKDPDFEEDHE